tara:strand:- start:11 stop:652 length:642 start_codon:yes stop_codon:yes gene_type:complete
MSESELRIAALEEEVARLKATRAAVAKLYRNTEGIRDGHKLYTRNAIFRALELSADNYDPDRKPFDRISYHPIYLPNEIMREILSFQFHYNKKHPTALLIIDYMNKHRMSPYNSAISIVEDETCDDYDDFCDWQRALKNNNTHLWEYEPFAFIDHVWSRLGDQDDLNAMSRLFLDIELDITRDMIIANRCKPGPSGRRHLEFIGRKLDLKLRR